MSLPSMSGRVSDQAAARRRSRTEPRGLDAEIAASLVAALDDESLALLAKRLSPFLSRGGEERLLDTATAASHLGIHTKTLERAARAGRVVGARRVGDQWRFGERELDVLPSVRRKPSPRPRRQTSRASCKSDVAGAIRGTGRRR